MPNQAHSSQSQSNKSKPKKKKINIQELKNEIALDYEKERSLTEISDIGSAIGLEEIPVDPAELNTITVDDNDDNWDVDDDGIIDESDDQEMIRDLPQEITQSLGTGLQGKPTDRAGRRAHLTQGDQFNQADAILTAGDIDASIEQANAVGDEAVGGTAETPDKDIVDEIGAAVGLEMRDRSSLRTTDFLEKRDDQRWELDPNSSEDFEERQDDDDI